METDLVRRVYQENRCSMKVGDKVKVYMTSENVEEGVCPTTYAADLEEHHGGPSGHVIEITEISDGYATVKFPSGYQMMKMEQLEVISESR